VIVHRDGVTRRDDAMVIPASVPEIGHFLRRERTRQSLQIEDVAASIGVDPQQLQGLEGGTVDRLPDRVGTLKVLRRYADFLGLPGEQYVLVLVEHWPAGSLAPVVAVRPVVPRRPDDTGSVPAAASRIIPVSDALAPAASSVAASRIVPVSGSVVPAPAVVVPAPAVVVPVSGTVLPGPAGSLATGPGMNARLGLPEMGADPPTAQVPRYVDATGPIPATTAWPAAQARSSVALRVMVGAVAVALLVGVAGIVIDRVRPQWLRDIGLNPPGSANATSSTPASVPVFRQSAWSPGAVTFDVRANAFVVSAVAGDTATFMQLGAPGSPPLFAGVVAAGDKHTVVVHHTLVVTVGGPSVRVFVAAGGRLIGGYAPASAPFTMTFRAAG
jgi:transcriptional regulator with XRE-family HTH domain